MVVLLDQGDHACAMEQLGVGSSGGARVTEPRLWPRRAGWRSQERFCGLQEEARRGRWPLRQAYCTFERRKIADVGTLSFS